jgi:hypothetical protein
MRQLLIHFERGSIPCAYCLLPFDNLMVRGVLMIESQRIAFYAAYKFARLEEATTPRSHQVLARLPMLLTSTQAEFGRNARDTEQWRWLENRKLSETKHSRMDCVQMVR